MRFDYDLSSAPVLAAVDDGIYLLKVIEAKSKVNDKGNTDIQVEMHIEAPDALVKNASGGMDKVEVLYIHYYISKDPTEVPKSLGFIKPLFEACGKLQPGQPYFEFEDIYGCLFGAEITKTAGTPEYPNPQNRIKNYFPQSNMPAPQLKPKQ